MRPGRAIAGRTSLANVVSSENLRNVTCPRCYDILLLVMPKFPAHEGLADKHTGADISSDASVKQLWSSSYMRYSSPTQIARKYRGSRPE